MVSSPHSACEFTRLVDRFCASLIASANPEQNSEPDLGGKLLFAGELSPEARALVVAANIAGAATLVCSADPATQREAIRDGVVDFLVTSLDEALRILKNEIRKHQPVAVCVGTGVETLLIEMQERGVRPDISVPVPLVEADCLMSWSVASAPAKWLPKLDALAMDNLRPGKAAGRRWLRLAPRYMGRLAHGVRVLRCEEAEADRFLEAARELVVTGEIGVAVRIRVERRGETVAHDLEPASF